MTALLALLLIPRPVKPLPTTQIQYIDPCPPGAMFYPELGQCRTYADDRVVPHIKKKRTKKMGKR